MGLVQYAVLMSVSLRRYVISRGTERNAGDTSVCMRDQRLSFGATSVASQLHADIQVDRAIGCVNKMCSTVEQKFV